MWEVSQGGREGVRGHLPLEPGPPLPHLCFRASLPASLILSSSRVLGRDWALCWLGISDLPPRVHSLEDLDISGDSYVTV